MNDEFNKDSMLDLFIFETYQLLEELEHVILDSEKAAGFADSIGEIFRTMHTIKGSAAMMQYTNISELAHAIEDLFFFLREQNPPEINTSKIIDLVLEGVDFIKNELGKVERKEKLDGDPTQLIAAIEEYLGELQAGAGIPQKSKAKKKGKKEIKLEDAAPVENSLPSYQAVIRFEPDCGFEDVQAFALMNNIKSKVSALKSEPEFFIDDEDGIQAIKNNGLKLTFQSGLPEDELLHALQKNAFVDSVTLERAGDQIPTPDKEKKTIDLGETVQPESVPVIRETPKEKETKKQTVRNDLHGTVTKPSFINVSVNKLDVLLDLVGELVISEAMVTHNPELEGLQLDNFYKAARQLRKITNELQDVVMSIRMVPLAATFQKMQRIVRDMSKKLGKDVQLEVVGEETEVDKNIIEHISDPLMHLIRNSMDHGIETAEERRSQNKPETGKITLEAKNAGGDVLIKVRDDGRGLNRDKILEKARANGLVTKPENELTDREIYAFTLLPGFSTKEKVTEYSGRGVGMDVVVKEIEKVGGTVQIDSTPGLGATITLKIPLTLAIVDGMTLSVGKSQYTVATTSIRESFRVKKEDVIVDPDGNEMILIRGICYPLIRLHQLFHIKTEVTEIDRGVVMMVENNEKGLCLFADQLLGEQQVVVKALPKYIKKVKGISGCTLLGDGSISLIMDVPGLIQMTMES